MAFCIPHIRLYLALLSAFFIGGCVTIPTPAERYAIADRLARSADMAKIDILANGFALVAYERMGSPGVPLNIYIEGDGFAWTSRRRQSDDPTPTDPVALRLAIQDPSANVVYLARPCQYIPKAERNRCQEHHWSTNRFSEPMIAAMDQAIDDLVARAATTGVNLIGYSGGGAVAALVAARRQDVQTLRTVAGNLDLTAFTAYHNTTPLAGSLNPSDFASELASLPQRHFIVEDDRIVPRKIVRKYLSRMPNQNCVGVTSVENATHQSGWIERWLTLMAQPVVCNAG